LKCAVKTYSSKGLGIWEIKKPQNPIMVKAYDYRQQYNMTEPVGRAKGVDALMTPGFCSRK